MPPPPSMRVQGAPTLGGLQAQHRLGLLDEFGQHLHQQRVAGIERIEDDLAVLAGQHPALLASAAFAWVAEVAFDALLGPLAGRQAGQIDIQDEPLRAKGVVRHLAVALQQRGEHLLQLGHVVLGGGIQRLLGHRLLGAALAPRRALQGGLLREQRIELHQALGARQQGQQDILHFVLRAIFDGLLRNVDARAHLVEDAAGLQMGHQRGQAGMGALNACEAGCGRLRHADPPERSETNDNNYSQDASAFFFLGKLIRAIVLALIWTKIRF